MKRETSYLFLLFTLMGFIVLWRFFGVDGNQVLREVGLPGALQQSIYPHAVVIAILYVLIYSSVWFVVWWKVGREYIAIPVFETAATALPPVRRSPALVAYLVNQGRVDGSAYAATILYLAQKKMIRIEENKGIYTIYYQPEKCTGEVDLIDRHVFNNLLHMTFGNDFVTYDELIVAMKERPQEMVKFYGSWKKVIGMRAEQLGFFEKKGTAVRRLFYVVSAFFAVPLVMLLETANIIGDDASIPTIWFLLGYMNAIFFIGKAFMRWDRKHTDEVGRWIAFKRYISGVSRIGREGPQAMAVWEDVLIYATALGCAKKVDEALPMILPRHNEEHSLGTFLLDRYD